MELIVDDYTKGRIKTGYEIIGGLDIKAVTKEINANHALANMLAGIYALEAVLKSNKTVNDDTLQNQLDKLWLARAVFNNERAIVWAHGIKKEVYSNDRQH